MKKIWFVLIAVLLTMSFTVYFTLMLKSADANAAPMQVKIIGEKSDKMAVSLYQTAVKLAPSDMTVTWSSDIPHLKKATAIICSANKCSLPSFTPEQLERSIARFSPQQTNMPTKALVSSPSQLKDLLDKKRWWIIVPAFWVLGLLLSLTPCVLPLLIIITSIIGGSNEALSKKRAFLLASIYVLTLSITYAIAGMMVASFGFYLQGYMQNAWVIGSFSLLFVLLGFSALGFFNLQLPTHWRKTLFLYNQSHGGTYVGVALMGVLATLIASPCVAAPLAGLLAYVTQSGNVELGAISLFSMGLGIGSPLIIISTVGSGLLQKAGRWQPIIKKGFGLLLLGIAIWLLARIISGQQTMLLWAALAIFASIYMGALTNQYAAQYEQPGTRVPSHNLLRSLSKTISLMVLIYGIALIFGAYLGNTNPFAPLSRQATPTPSLQAPISELIDVKKLSTLKNVLAAAKNAHKPVFLFVTAKWCSACHALEKNVLSDPKVQNELKNFISLRADLTDISSKELNSLGQLNIIGPPTLLFYDAAGTLSAIRFDGGVNANELTTNLQSIAKGANA